MHRKDRLEVAATAALLHFALKCQQTGVLKEHHGKAAHQRVVQAIVDAIGLSDIWNMREVGRQYVNHGLQGQTL